MIVASTALILLHLLRPHAAVVQDAAQDGGATLLAPLAGRADEGRFRIYVNEEPLITIDHAWRADGGFSGTSLLALAGQEVTFELDIEVDDGGRFRELEMRNERGDVRVWQADGKLRVNNSATGKSIDLEPKAGTRLWFDYQPALARLVFEAYDTQAGGEQEIPVFVIPGALLDGRVERLETQERPLRGRDLQLTRWAFGLATVDMFVTTDADGSVLLIEVPAQHAAYVREGYEGLRLAGDEEELLSRPVHEVRVLDEVMVPMRDGIGLATDLYLPDAEGPHPTVLVRTPYKKEMNELQGRYYARRGYAVAIQDCRGRFGSQGTWVPFFHEPQDGYDTIEWLAEQDWSDGKIGMIGASYLGWVQWWAAREKPEHLVTIIPNVAPPDPFFNIPYEYGVFFLTGAIWWANVLEKEATADLSGAAFSEVMQEDYEEKLKHLPVIELDEIVLGARNEYWRSWIEHPSNDAWWARASFLDHLAEVDIPVLHQSGWYDGDGIGSKLNYAAMASHGHAHQKLVLGPWGHTDTAVRGYGGYDFGPQAAVDLQRDYLRWFDHWLKGVDNGIEREPLVSLFVMGTNEWLHGETYPLEGTRIEAWYLRGGGNANTSGGDGRLSPEPPPADEASDSYVYDPADPTPATASLDDGDEDEPQDDAEPEPPGEEAVEASTAAAEGGDSRDQAEAKPRKPQPFETRRDILVYRSDPAEETLRIVGPITAVLWASTDAKDTDWFVRLARIDAEGEAHPLVEGRLRARFRESCAEPELLEPGAVARYEIDCWQTGIAIQPGERLQVEVASASFPMFSRNLNTGGHNETETDFVAATQTILHDAEHPSHVLLPIVPEQD